MRKCAPIIAALIVFAEPAHAINKCPSPGGGWVFQDAPCEGGETLNVTPAAGHAAPSRGGPAINAEALNAAIIRGEPAIGMTRQQLDAAMGGRPNRINPSNHNGVQLDQLIYEKGDGRIWYVYLESGLVRSIQNTGGGRNVERESRGPICPSGTEIRAVETQASSITITEAERNALLRKARAMRAACGQ